MADSLSHLCMSLSNLPGFLKGFARIVRDLHDVTACQVDSGGC